MGAWIVKWYSHLTFVHWYAMPWAVSSSFGADNSFLDPSTTSTHYFMISIWFIWSDTTLFVCQICHWIVKQKKEIKEIYFKKRAPWADCFRQLHHISSKFTWTGMVNYLVVGNLLRELQVWIPLKCKNAGLAMVVVVNWSACSPSSPAEAYSFFFTMCVI